MWGLVEKAVIGILLIWVCLAVHQIIIYEEGVYDCSNMVADQELFFDSFGIDTKIGMQYRTEDEAGHVWLILPYGIPFECTILCVVPFNHKPDEVFKSVDELVSIYPYAKDDFVTSC